MASARAAHPHRYGSWALEMPTAAHALMLSANNNFNSGEEGVPAHALLGPMMISSKV